MGQSQLDKNKVARAAAILTTGEVAASDLDLSESTAGGRVVVDIAFTLGSLTNVTIRAYGSFDGVTWKQLREGPGGTLVSLALTANDSTAWSIEIPSGMRRFRVSAQGSGTVTSSSLAMTYRYRRRGSD